MNINVEIMAYAGLASLTLLLLMASWHDVRTHRIPNKLVLTGMILGVLLNGLMPAGLGINSAYAGGLGWSTALKGLGVGLIVMLPFYLLRAMGAGDVKLMAMVGAFVGVQQVLGAIVTTFLVGGVMAICVALKTGTLKNVLQNLRFMLFLGAIKVSAGQAPTVDGTAVSSVKLPYAVAIAIGTLGYLLWYRIM